VKGIAVFLDGFAELAEAVEDGAQVVPRNVIARISLRPHFIRLASLFQITRDKMLVAGFNTELFRLADSLSQLVALRGILHSQTGFAEVVVAGPECGVGQGKIWVETDGSLVFRHSTGVISFHHLDLPRQTVRLKGFE
jgi:hypothetical protein